MLHKKGEMPKLNAEVRDPLGKLGRVADTCASAGGKSDFAVKVFYPTENVSRVWGETDLEKVKTSLLVCKYCKQTKSLHQPATWSRHQKMMRGTR